MHQRQGGACCSVPFAPTGWTTVWLDHLSFRVTNYKESASFYSNLLGWSLTYDEGSQQELMIGDVGDIIVRGGNPNDPNFGKSAPRQAPTYRSHLVWHLTLGYGRCQGGARETRSCRSMRIPPVTTIFTRRLQELSHDHAQWIQPADQLCHTPEPVSLGERC